MAGEEDLGALIPGDGQPAGAPPAKSWQQLYSDPTIASGLMGLGLSLMRGGYGSGTQQMAQAGSDAMTAAGNTAGHILENQRYEQKQADTKSEKASDRASHEKIANITSEGRITAKQIGADASKYRADLMFQKAGVDQQRYYLGLAEKSVAATLGDISLDDKTRTELVKAKAAEYYQTAVEMKTHGGQSGGAPGAPPAASASAPGATSTPGQPAASATGAPKPTWDQIIKNPTVQKMLESAPGRKRLLLERPDLRDQIEATMPKDLYGN